MGQAEFPRTWVVAAPKQSCGGAAVVWSSERTFAVRVERILLFAGNGADASDGQRFFLFQRGEQCRKLMGQSALAAAWRPDQQEVVP